MDVEYKQWGNTFEEAVLNVIRKRNKEVEERSLKLREESYMTPQKMAEMIKNGIFPFAPREPF